VLFLLRKIGKINKLVKLSLKLWPPLLINLALVRELFEIEANIGGLAREIFDFARQYSIDFLVIVILVIALDLLYLWMLGFDVKGLLKKTWDGIKNCFGKTDITSQKQETGKENKKTKKG
jgi:hypothetical protein